MSDDRAAKLFDEAATAGLRITGLDGWTQTRLAGSLKLRREVVNAIINRDPVAAPSDSRPRMVEACRKIIAFAAVISRKDDAVVPREVDAAGRPDDDAQAYETHKLQLRRLVESAVGGGAFIEGMCRVGELSSRAVHAAPRFRVRMIGNVVTAVQRLLDKPESRSIPADLLAHNLRRLTLAEWAARRAARATPADARAKAGDDLAYIRGQVGYAMIFNGLLLRSGKAVRRGRRRLWRAARVQPSPDYGHWSNLLRATNDLLANRHRPARRWATALVRMAEKQNDPGFALAYTRLRDNAELTTLVALWDELGVTARVAALFSRAQDVAPRPAARAKRAKGTTAAAILLLVGLLTAPSAVRAGDGKELSARRSPPQRVAASTAGTRADTTGVASANGSVAAAPRDQAYPSRAGASAPQRPSFYPARRGAIAADVDAAPASRDDGPTIARSRFARPGALPTRLSPRYAKSAGLDEDETAATPLAADAASDADVDALLDDADLPRPAPRPARSAAPARRGNRMFPLIVVRDPDRAAPTKAPAKRPARPKTEATEDANVADRAPVASTSEPISAAEADLAS